MRTSIRLIGAAVATAATVLLVPAAAAQADDHLFSASNASGTDARGFTNPVAANPSGTSGAASQPGTVPGLGDPKVGEDTGTPSFSSEVLCERTAARSEGTPAFCP